MSAAFDTLTYAKRLREAGFTESQAEAQADALRAVVDANLATKQDIEGVRYEIEALRQATKQDIEGIRHGIEALRQATKQDIEGIRYEIEALRQATKTDIAEVKRDIETLRHDLGHQIRELESRIVLRLGGLIVGGVVVLAALMKFL